MLSKIKKYIAWIWRFIPQEKVKLNMIFFLGGGQNKSSYFPHDHAKNVQYVNRNH